MGRGLYLFTLPSGKATGASVPTLQLAHALKDRGRRVVFLCQKGKLARAAQEMGLEVYPFSLPSLAKWGRRAEAIVTSRSHDHFWALLLRRGKTPVFRLWYKPLPPKGYFWDLFLVPFSARFLAPFTFGMGWERRWSWLPGGVDTDLFRPGDKMGGGMGVAMVARMKPGRGQEELLEALAGLEAPVEVTFLGGGETLEGMESLARELGVDARCCFIKGKVEDYPSFLRRYHLLVYLSLGSESTARTVLEAMASGLVVLAVAQGGVSYYLGEWNPPIAVEELVGELFRYSWSPRFRRMVGLLNARRAVRFSLEARVRRFVGALGDASDTSDHIPEAL